MTDTAPTSAPTDVEHLQRLLIEQQARLAEQQAQLAHYHAENERLREQLTLLFARKYGRSSEKGLAAAGQLGLFNEAEVAADTAETEEEPTAEVKPYTRRRGKRMKLPEFLPRMEIRHELPEQELTGLKAIGEEVSEQLDIVPAKVRVLRHVRVKYAPTGGNGPLRIAPMPLQPIPKSIASPGLLAHIIVAKYQDALPLYRQEHILARAGMELPRATTARWVIRCAALIQPLLNLVQDELLAYDFISMDETTLQVLKEPGRSASSLSYLWARRGGPPGRPIILFHYAPSRGAKVPRALLGDFRGYLQTDGYSAYKALGEGIVAVGCWAHARRGFTDAIKGQGRKGKRGKAQEALAFIRQLYAIEKQAAENKLTAEQRRDLRQQQAKPMLERLQRWLEQTLPQVPPQSLLGQALGYMKNQWPALVRYLDDGRIPIDNNLTENAIRPFVIGRRNWLFSDTPSGASASAALYSLIETAKANGLEPYDYLRHVFTHLPAANSVEQVETLLPWHLCPRDITTA